jgi:UDP-3-O-[3-hydroxymyristoyl] glucosamine N-acyltransferase
MSVSSGRAGLDAVITLQHVLERSGGDWVNREASSATLGSLPSEIRVTRPVPLSGSKSGELAYYFSREYRDELAHALPTILITSPKFTDQIEKTDSALWSQSAVVSCKDPYFVMALLSADFADALSTVAHLRRPEFSTIHPSAHVHPSAHLGLQVKVGPNCVIDEGVRIGRGSILYPGVILGPNVSIGEDCVLFPGVVVYEDSQLGNRVRVHAQAVIGADGFGYAPRMQDGQPQGHQKIYHLGQVIIHDDVEIGASTTIDRGTVGPTVLERFVIVDNQVQIAHNCFIGEGAIICGGSGIAGRARLGRYAIVGGMAALSNSVSVGDRAMVVGTTTVIQDVPTGAVVMGNPQRDKKEFFRIQSMLTRMLAERQAKGSSPVQEEI